MRVSKDKDVLFYNAVNRDGEMGDAQIRGSNVSPPWLTGQHELGNDQNAALMALCRDKSALMELPPRSISVSLFAVYNIHYTISIRIRHQKCLSVESMQWLASYLASKLQLCFSLNKLKQSVLIVILWIPSDGISC